jgi:hypothetical protein
VSVYQGDSLTLYCKATGEGVQMTWLKDGQVITPGQSAYKWVALFTTVSTLIHFLLQPVSFIRAQATIVIVD